MKLIFRGGSFLVGDFFSRHNRSGDDFPSHWSDLLSRESVTLLCFCVNPQRCHRTVLAAMLGELGASVMGERQLSMF